MAVLRYLAITLTLLFLSGCEIDFGNDKESDPAPKRISGDLVVTFPPEGSNLGGKATVTSVSGYVDSIVKGDNLQSDVESIMVNGVKAKWNPKRKGYWTADMPVIYGENSIEVVASHEPDASLTSEFKNFIFDLRVSNMFYLSGNRWIVSTLQGWLLDVDLSTKNYSILHRPNASEERFERYTSFKLSKDRADLYLWEQTQKKLLRYSFSDKRMVTLWQDKTDDGLMGGGFDVGLTLDENINRVFLLSSEKLYEFDISSAEIEEKTSFSRPDPSGYGILGCAKNIHYSARTQKIYSFHPCNGWVSEYNPTTGETVIKDNLSEKLKGKYIASDIRSDGEKWMFQTRQEISQTENKKLYRYESSVYDIASGEYSNIYATTNDVHVIGDLHHSQGELYYLNEYAVFRVSSPSPVFEDPDANKSVEFYNLYKDSAGELKAVAKVADDSWATYRFGAGEELVKTAELNSDIQSLISRFSTRPESGRLATIATWIPGRDETAAECIVRQVDFAEQVIEKTIHVQGKNECRDPVFAILGILTPFVRVSSWQGQFIVDSFLSDTNHVYDEDGTSRSVTSLIKKQFPDHGSIGLSLPLPTGELLIIGRESAYIIDGDDNSNIKKLKVDENLLSIFVEGNYLYDSVYQRFVSYPVYRQGWLFGDIRQPLRLVSVTDDRVNSEIFAGRSGVSRQLDVIAADEINNRLIGFDRGLKTLVMTNLDSGDQALLPVVFNQ